MQMDKDYIEKFDVIRRYHKNKLTDEELDSFEVYILENPDIINVIEKEKAIHEAFKEHEALLKESEASSQSLPWGKGLAMAACLFVAVFAVINFQGNQTDYALQPPVILETFRGAGSDAIEVSGLPVVQFQVDMGPVELLESQLFSAELSSASGNTVYQVSGLPVDGDGWVYYILEDQVDILSGQYEVKVYPDDNPDRISTFPVVFISP